jgi:2'-5' RNA ligase
MDDADQAPFLRAFLGIGLDEPTRAGLAAFIERLRRGRPHVAWVPPPNLHLSLLFLGNINRDLLEPVAAAMDAIAAAHKPFGVRLGTPGAFGSPRAPRVLWAGVDAPPGLYRLQEALAAAVRDLGLRLESRPYRPHITLGRVRSPRGRETLLASLEALGPTLTGGFAVDAFVLFQSLLSPTGARYRVLHRCALQD